MAIYKSEKYVWNSVTETWDLYYDKTSADNIVETSLAKVLTNVERDKISDYLTTFNIANKLLLLNGSGKIPGELIDQDFSEYIKRDGSVSMDSSLDMGGSDIDNISGIYFGTGSPFIVNESGDLRISLASGKYFKIDGDTDQLGYKIFNLADPTNPQDAANMRWVEQLVSQGTHVIAAVRAATTGNVSSLSGEVTIDGVALVEEDRVLVKEQTTPAENGVYIVNSGAWTKISNDSDKSSLVSVLEGTTQTRHQYYNQDGTTWVLYWVDDNYYATVNGGLELHTDGFGFGIKAAGVTNAMLYGEIQSDKIYNISRDNMSWSSMDPATNDETLDNKIDMIFSSIRLLRGTGSYHADNTQTIADAYDKIALKNSVTYGTGVPPAGNPGGADGDIYLKRLA